MLKSWGVKYYTQMWGDNGKAVLAADNVSSIKRQHAVACLAKVVDL